MSSPVAQFGLWPEYAVSPPEETRIQRVGRKSDLSPWRANPATDADLVLASGSASKVAILKSLGLRFVVDPANVDESDVIGMPPANAVGMLSERKARAVAERHPAAITLGADTLAHLDGELLGKPRDSDDALRMLCLLAGREHTIVTGVTLVFDGGAVTRHAHTRVRFRDCPVSTLRRYVSTGEPLGKAGSYALQATGAILVESIDGEYTNVLGLPVGTFVDGLAELGFKLL